MSQAESRIPTRKVRLKETGDEIIINKADFDPEVHEPAEERKKLKKDDGDEKPVVKK